MPTLARPEICTVTHLPLDGFWMYTCGSSRADSCAARHKEFVCCASVQAMQLDPPTRWEGDITPWLSSKTDIFTCFGAAAAHKQHCSLRKRCCKPVWSCGKQLAGMLTTSRPAGAQFQAHIGCHQTGLLACPTQTQSVLRNEEAPIVLASVSSL